MLYYLNFTLVSNDKKLNRRRQNYPSDIPLREKSVYLLTKSLAFLNDELGRKLIHIQHYYTSFFTLKSSVSLQD